ncbi:MAG TPA: ATP synthase F1 subunit epsilon, partial [Candidatus Mediterraneibacter ornithocaccae]|nr:ATP synthase F1 subunit epsilon [Candidatus Mediterraneibacter ornithocaccae]
EQMRQKQSIQEYYHTQASLARAMTRLRVAQDKKWNI